jgi:hypothetical protein
MKELEARFKQQSTSLASTKPSTALPPFKNENKARRSQIDWE